jgi:hypothetical protein
METRPVSEIRTRTAKEILTLKAFNGTRTDLVEIIIVQGSSE